MRISLSSATDPTPQNVETTCRIGSVLYDQQHGMGETPNGRNIVYRGFATLMPGTTFLELAAPGKRDEDSVEIAKRISEGQAIASPFLELDLTQFMTAFEDEEDPPIPSVIGHEGRGRVTALIRLGQAKSVLVHVFIGHYRARHLNELIFDLLNVRGIRQEKTGKLVTNPFGTIFWNDQVIFGRR